MADEKITRPRGRPKKEADVATVEPVAVENDSNTVEDQTAEMQKQLRTQFAVLLQLAERSGIKLNELYDVPPSEDTVIIDSEAADEIPEAPESKLSPAEKAGRLKPGTVLPGGTWIPWTKADLDQDDTITFVPYPVPGIVFPITDEYGRQKIKMDVNDLVCWLTVGVSNTVNRFFYNAYNDCYEQWLELEKFKREGPNSAPWGAMGPDGRKAWRYTPSAPSFGMTDDAKFLGPNSAVAGSTPPPSLEGEE